MVDFKQLNLLTVKMNNANLKRLKIGELKEMLKEHTWRGEVVEVDFNFKLLIKYVLGKRNSYGN